MNKKNEWGEKERRLNRNRVRKREKRKYIYIYICGWIKRMNEEKKKENKRLFSTKSIKWN